MVTLNVGVGVVMHVYIAADEILQLDTSSTEDVRRTSGMLGYGLSRSSGIYSGPEDVPSSRESESERSEGEPSQES